MINFEQARLLAIQAVRNYLVGMGGGDRYGLYHGTIGKNRTVHLGQYLNALAGDSENNEEALLALFLAVFGVIPQDVFFSNPFRNLGRSSKLASLIADSWIQGDITSITNKYGHWGNNTPLTSTVFSVSALAKEKTDGNNYHNTASNECCYSYFDKTRAARQLVNKILNGLTCQKSKTAILESTSILRAYLESSQRGIKKSLLPFHSSEKTLIKAAVLGAFAGKVEQGKAHKDGLLCLSSFLNRRDAANLMRINKAAAKTSQIEMEEKIAASDKNTNAQFLASDSVNSSNNIYFQILCGIFMVLGVVALIISLVAVNLATAGAATGVAFAVSGSLAFFGGGLGLVVNHCKNNAVASTNL